MKPKHQKQIVNNLQANIGNRKVATINRQPVAGNLNAEDLGLKCGLEIHQQLEGRKLFCFCPAAVKDAVPDAVVQRRIRAVTGELGGVDVVALEESTKARRFVYEYFDDFSCLVELDECPPYPLNLDALKTVVQFSKMVGADIVDAVQMMRKTIVDGSNTSGFQRTGLVARNGFLKAQNGPVSIHSISIEEDSARIMRESADEAVYRLDRLGIPLVEITTGPDIKSPEHCKEVAEQIGLLLRSTGAVKRGLGTIRQDINISIKDGARVELKGVQDFRHIPSIIEFEILRQKNLLRIKDEFRRRGINKVKEVVVYMTELLKNSESKIIRSAVEKKGAVVGLRLENFAGLFGFEVQPNKRFGTELSDKAKSLAGVGGIFHSDELPKYGISAEDVSKIKTLLGCRQNDGFILIADQKERASKALKIVIERIHEAVHGVPKEVRRVNADHSSSFERRMPGSARMYPETDIPLIKMTGELLDIRLPELIQDKIKRYEKLGLAKDLAGVLAKSERAFLFDDFIKEFNGLKASYVAECLVSLEKNMKRNFNIDVLLSEDDFKVLFGALNKEKISKESVVEILKEKKPVRQVIGNYAVLSDEQIESVVKEIFSQNKSLPENALIGRVMSQLRGKAPGNRIVEIVKRLKK